MFIAHDGRTYRCYVTSTGREKHWLGCQHAKPREAIAHTVPVFVPASRSTHDAQTSGGDLTRRGSNEAPVRLPGEPVIPLPTAGTSSGGGLTETPDMASSAAGTRGYTPGHSSLSLE